MRKLQARFKDAWREMKIEASILLEEL